MTLDVQLLRNIFYIQIVLLYFWATQKLIGFHDLALVLVFILNFVIIFWGFNKIKQGLRNISKDFFTEDTFLFGFLSKRSLVQAIVTFFITLIITVGFLATLKVVFIKYNDFVALFALLIPLVFLSFLRNSIEKTTEVARKQFRDENSGVTAKYISAIILKTGGMLLFITLIFTALDTNRFLSDNTKFDEIYEVAGESALPKKPSIQKVTRPIVNFYILYDTAQSGFINLVLDGLEIEKTKSKYPLYFVIMLLGNLIKLPPFAFCFIIIASVLDPRLKGKINDNEEP